MVKRKYIIYFCADCHIECKTRSDTKATLCHKCSSKLGGLAMKGNFRTPQKKCKRCENLLRASKKDEYCSRQCRSIDKREERKCKFCNSIFHVLKSSLKTNARGNFCSRPCYEKWLCNTERKTGRGTQWKRIRNEIIKDNPFCGLCGTINKLEVHHIVPFRFTFDNDKSNLIPLCKKHHKIVETITHDVEIVENDHEIMKFILSNILFDWQSTIRMNFVQKKAILESTQQSFDEVANG